MKKTLLISSILISMLLVSCGNNDTKAAELVEKIPTVQAFKDEAVPQADINKIVQAGINSQSAMNGQPWHFSVVTNKEVLQSIADGMKSGMKAPPGDMPTPPAGGNMAAKAGIADSPLAIIISAKTGSEYDAGLATELMTIEAALLGYGTKIISSPTIALNGQNQDQYKKVLGIPEDMSAKGVLLIGKYEQSKSDAVTAATVRKTTEEVASFIY